ncbi:hypothetical protein F8388_000556 [Cannabis sativa]|uniref:Uncharacterized protein n=1 Tax=Cannabis sativa TaxID=3483 RepID=A0A7J6EZV8_CANSA|nr:hypothetical protein F8388_000556 [Cannabis sativa]
MARLRTTMDSAIWDLDVATPESLKAPLRLYQVSHSPWTLLEQVQLLKYIKSPSYEMGFLLALSLFTFLLYPRILIYRRVTTRSKSEACGVERVNKFRAGNEDRQAEEDHHIGMRIDRDPV